MSILNHLINEHTGEVDNIAVLEAATLRAAREYGSPNYPAAYFRDQLRWCQDRARDLRTAWRRDNGLPDDQPFFVMHFPDWVSRD